MHTMVPLTPVPNLCPQCDQVPSQVPTQVPSQPSSHLVTLLESQSENLPTLSIGSLQASPMGSTSQQMKSTSP